MRATRHFAAAGLGLSILVAACSGDRPTTTGNAQGRDAAAPAASAAPATGNVVEVNMVTDGTGSYFEPREITAQRGDVVRFVLVSGVHNASFPDADNPAGVTLPAASPYLQLPGQTHDLAVDLPAGEYSFQCDPHAALGMVGELTVE